MFSPSPPILSSSASLVYAIFITFMLFNFKQNDIDLSEIETTNISLNMFHHFLYFFILLSEKHLNGRSIVQLICR